MSDRIKPIIPGIINTIARVYIPISYTTPYFIIQINQIPIPAIKNKSDSIV